MFDPSSSDAPPVQGAHSRSRRARRGWQIIGERLPAVFELFCRNRSGRLIKQLRVNPPQSARRRFDVAGPQFGLRCRRFPVVDETFEREGAVSLRSVPLRLLASPLGQKIIARSDLASEHLGGLGRFGSGESGEFPSVVRYWPPPSRRFWKTKYVDSAETRTARCGVLASKRR